MLWELKLTFSVFRALVLKQAIFRESFQLLIKKQPASSKTQPFDAVTLKQIKTIPDVPTSSLRWSLCHSARSCWLFSAESDFWCMLGKSLPCPEWPGTVLTGLLGSDKVYLHSKVKSIKGKRWSVRFWGRQGDQIMTLPCTMQDMVTILNPTICLLSPPPTQQVHETLDFNMIHRGEHRGENFTLLKVQLR